jgi:hypothetical protein
MRTCSVEGCNSPHEAKGLCVKHYKRFQIHGSTENRIHEFSDIERFNQRYLVNNMTGCWEWVGYKTAAGYGRFMYKRKAIRAHRFSYQYHKGKNPEGYEICHHCDNTSCVNPEHLFLGTAKDNARDRDQKGRNSRKERTRLAGVFIK